MSVSHTIMHALSIIIYKVSLTFSRMLENLIVGSLTEMN